MSHGYTTLTFVMLTAAWLLLAGCNAQAGGGGAGPIPINQSGEPGGGDGSSSGPVIGGGTGGGDTDGGATDGSEPDTGGDGDVGTGGDVSTDGDDSDISTDGAQPDPGGGDNGGGDLPPGVSPPSVVLSVTNLSPSIGDTLFLTCVVIDSGGLVPFDYRFDSSAGSAFIVQNGSELASAEVLASPLTINYWCSASNAAGRGDPSPLVIVAVASGSL